MSGIWHHHNILHNNNRLLLNNTFIFILHYIILIQKHLEHWQSYYIDCICATPHDKLCFKRLQVKSIPMYYIHISVVMNWTMFVCVWGGGVVVSFQPIIHVHIIIFTLMSYTAFHTALFIHHDGT